MDEQTVQVVGAVMELDELVFAILEYLPTSDVKSCNGVNRLWRQEARKLLLKRTRVEFNEPGLVTKIMEYMEELGDQCHQSVSFGRLDDTNAEKEMTATTTFVNKYGNKIQTLGVTLGNPEILKPFQPFRNITTLNVAMDWRSVKVTLWDRDYLMSGVKTLGVSVVQGSNLIFGVKKCMAEYLLRMCPIVETLCLTEEVQSAFLALFMQRRDAEYDRSRAPITGLKLISDRSDPDILFQLLLSSTLKLNLTMLDITVDEMERRIRSLLEQVLAKYAATLKQLHLRHYQRQHQIEGMTSVDVNFPKMPNLEILEITRHHENQHMGSRELMKFIFDSPIEKINYVEQYPVLKKLNIKDVIDTVALNAVHHVDTETGRIELDLMGGRPRRMGSQALCDIFFGEGTLPCLTVKHIDVDYCASMLRPEIPCTCGRYCFCNRRKDTKEFVRFQRMADVFVNATELKNFREWQALNLVKSA